MLRFTNRFYTKAIIKCLLTLIVVGCSKDTLTTGEEIIELNPPAEYDALMADLKPATNPNAVSLLWFTDLHAQTENLKRIQAWYKRYATFFDDVISTGDQQDSFFTQNFEWWSENGAGHILQVVGNHDAWISDAMYENGAYEGQVVRHYGISNKFWILSQKDTYNKYFAPFIGLWGVTQPEYAREKGKCYYYKDYGNLRLIVLDCKHYGTIDDIDENKESLQDKWLISVLDDARSREIPVLIATHYPPGNSIPIECSYTPKNTKSQYGDKLNSNANKRVTSFIDNGGEFVGWIYGHSHYDKIEVLASDPRQLMICCATANHNRSKQFARFEGTKNQDSFNCISIDTKHKQIYMVKVGADMNGDNERKRIVKYNYCDYTDESGVIHERGLVCSL